MYILLYLCYSNNHNTGVKPNTLKYKRHYIEHTLFDKQSNAIAGIMIQSYFMKIRFVRPPFWLNSMVMVLSVNVFVGDSLTQNIKRDSYIKFKVAVLTGLIHFF